MEQKNNKRQGGSYVFREAKIPQPVETIKKQTVFWGADNLYPQFLFKLYYESPIHGGIVNSKVTFITSGGLSCEGCSPQDWENIQNNGRNAYSLNDIIPQVARDNEVTDSFVYYFKKAVDGYWYLKPMDIELIRKMENDVNTFEYSEDWSSNKKDESVNYRQIKSINAIDENSLECIMYVSSKAKQYNVSLTRKAQLTQNYYSTPVYSGAISSILADEEMNFFHYSEVINGFKGGTLISMNSGIPDNETEENKIIKKIKGEASKRETQGGIAVTWSDGKEQAPTVLQLNGNNLDSRYLLTQEHLRDSILVAHSVITPALFGIKTPGQLGNTQELLTGYLVFKDSYVRKRQEQIADSLSLALKTLNGFTGKIVFDDYIPEYLGGIKTDEKTEMKTQEPTTEEVLAKFETCGKPVKDFNFLSSRNLQVFENVELNESEFLDEYRKSTFADSVSTVQNKILQMIASGESYQAIKQATELSAVDLTKEILKLKTKGLIERKDWKLTESGKRSSETQQKLSVVYTYELRPDAPALVKGGESREFCKTLIGFNRVYTRDEINSISSGIGRNVWLFRGGWYHDPKKDINQPSCRHYWKQNIILNN